MRGIVAVLVLALAACAEPSYVETAGVTPMGQPSTWTNEVLFQVHDAFRQTPPDCVAILPLNAAAELADGAEAAAKVRRALFAQLAPQARDVQHGLLQQHQLRLDLDVEAARSLEQAQQHLAEGDVLQRTVEDRFAGRAHSKSTGAEL